MKPTPRLKLFAEQVAKLWSALEEGEECVVSAWRRKWTMSVVTDAMMRKVMGVVKSIVTKDRASQALYQACFPNEILVEQYKENKARQKRRTETKASNAAKRRE